MPEEKNYINGMVIKEKVFDNGGKQLRVWIRVDDLIEQIKDIEENGSANLIISRRKEPSESGVTHYAYEDSWKPSQHPVDQHGPDYSQEPKNKDDGKLPF